jgi:predicted DNA-binding protein (MmcQ/YjbR family)
VAQVNGPAVAREEARVAKKKSASRRAKPDTPPPSRKAAVKRAKRAAHRGVDCERLHEFCRGLPGATVDLKWGEMIVWSVGRKMFIGFHEAEDGGPGLPFGFKCSEAEFDRLTDLPGIIPAPYAARYGWVSVREMSAISQEEAERLVGESYRLVVERLPRRLRDALGVPLIRKAATTATRSSAEPRGGR